MCCACPCVDKDEGATDSYGDNCAWYTDHPTDCGLYNTHDFDSTEMCCACFNSGQSEAGDAAGDQDCYNIPDKYDEYGDGCAWYDENQESCGYYDW